MSASDKYDFDAKIINVICKTKNCMIGVIFLFNKCFRSNNNSNIDTLSSHPH